MHITVAICTWNRADLLQQTLERMTKLRQPRRSWQLIVVNNNCTDDTDKVVARFASRLPMKCVHESTPGLSNARNAAVAAADGDYLVWTDDDVLVDTGWLCAYEEAFLRHPDADFFGGPVTPWFEGTAPRWIEEGWTIISTAFATRELGDKVFSFTHDVMPFGANYAVRLATQRQHPYDAKLGRIGTGAMSGEEVAVLRSILRSGGPGWWVPDARVQHYIPADRQTLRWIRRYYAGQGEQIGREEVLVGPTWFGRPRWVWRQALQNEIVWRWRRATGQPATSWINDIVSAAIAQGRLRVRR